MPRRNGTGPSGLGAMTGRRMGSCATENQADATQPNSDSVNQPNSDFIRQGLRCGRGRAVNSGMGGRGMGCRGMQKKNS